MIDYRYAIEECDIADRKKLKEFRIKRDEWLSWLVDSNHQAIADQITAMMWSDAIFRLVNETRNYADKAGGKFATLSGILAETIDRGYIAEQIVAFRKLTEREARDPKKQVISLRRLLDDVKENRELFTREIFVCYDGLPFQHNGGRIAADVLPDGHSGVIGVPAFGPKAHPMSFRTHKEFDAIVGAQSDHAVREELIVDAFLIT